MSSNKNSLYQWSIVWWLFFLLAVAVIAIIILFPLIYYEVRTTERSDAVSQPSARIFPGNKWMESSGRPFLVEGRHFGFPGPEREMELLVCSQLSAAQEIVASFEEWAPVTSEEESPYRKYTRRNPDNPGNPPVCRNERGLFYLVRRVEQRMITVGDWIEVFTIVEVRITFYTGALSEESEFYHITRIPVFSEREYLMWGGGEDI